MSYGYERDENEFKQREASTFGHAEESRAERKRSSTCQTCAHLDPPVHQVAHRTTTTGAGMCNWHFRGLPHPEEEKRTAQKQAEQRRKQALAQPDRRPTERREAHESGGAEKESNAMGITLTDRVCAKEGCTTRLGTTNKSGYCTFHFYYSKKNSGGAIGAGATASGRRSVKPRKATRAKQTAPASSNGNGLATIQVSEAALDNFWKDQSLEAKAQLFSKWLAEQSAAS